MLRHFFSVALIAATSTLALNLTTESQASSSSIVPYTDDFSGSDSLVTNLAQVEMRRNPAGMQYERLKTKLGEFLGIITQLPHMIKSSLELQKFYEME